MSVTKEQLQALVVALTNSTYFAVRYGNDPIAHDASVMETGEGSLSVQFLDDDGNSYALDIDEDNAESMVIDAEKGTINLSLEDQDEIAIVFYTPDIKYVESLTASLSGEPIETQSLSADEILAKQLSIYGHIVESASAVEFDYEALCYPVVETDYDAETFNTIEYAWTDRDGNDRQIFIDARDIERIDMRTGAVIDVLLSRDSESISVKPLMDASSDITSLKASMAELKRLSEMRNALLQDEGVAPR